MRRYLAALLGAAFLFSCSSTGDLCDPVANPECIRDSFRPYRACEIQMTGGRELMDPGLVVGHELQGKTRVYLFVADRHPNDGKHVKRVTRINRQCGGPTLMENAVEGRH